MRVFMITTMFPDPVYSFSGITIYNTMKCLREIGYEFHVVIPIPITPFPLNILHKTARRFRKYPQYSIYDGFSIEYMRYPLLPKYSNYYWFGDTFWNYNKHKLIERVLEFNPDIIWSQPSLPCGWAGLQICNKLPHLSNIVVVHGGDIHKLIKVHSARKRIIEVYNKTDRVIAVSDKLAQQIAILAPSTRCKVIPNGINIKEYELESNKYSDDNRSIRLVSVSNLIRTKGIEFNIIALSALTKEFPNLCYQIIGDGEDKYRLLDLVLRYGLEEKVEFLGYLDNNQVIEHLKYSHIFSLPSYEEGFGVVYLEAMAAGLPVIGIQDQGISDIIRNSENGFLVQPQQVEPIVEILRLLCSDGEFRKLIGNNGRKTAEQYDWSEISLIYDNEFKNIKSLT